MLGTHYVVRSSNGVLSGIGESSRLTFPSAVASFLELGPIVMSVPQREQTWSASRSLESQSLHSAMYRIKKCIVEYQPYSGVACGVIVNRL